MKPHEAIKVFEDKKVRALWDEDQEKWFVSIVDVIQVLTDSPNPRKYWSVLKILECIKNKTKERRKSVGYKL